MQISLCSIGSRKETLSDMIPRIAALGYDGVEVWEGHIRDSLLSSIDSDLNPDFELYRFGREWEAQLQAAKLAAPVVAGYFHFYEEGTRTVNNILRDYCIEKCRKLGVLAKILGGDKVRVMLDNVASQDATPDDWAQLGYGLKEMARAVQYLDVTLVLETHQNQLMDTTASTLRLLERAGERNIKVNLDIHNLYAIGEDPVQVLRTLYPHVAHMHFKNVHADKPSWLCDGGMDYRPFLQEVQALGYEGYASIEWLGEDFWGAAAHEREWLREVCGC